MRKNKKGLSAVVTTLIIILLTIVAIMIIWGVVKNLLDRGSDTIDTSTKCLDIDVKATNVVANGGGSYNVTVSRSSGGMDIEGLEIVVSSPTESSEPYDTATNLGPLRVTTYTTVANAALTGSATKATVLAYFIGASGEKQRCSATEYTFTAR